MAFIIYNAIILAFLLYTLINFILNTIFVKDISSYSGKASPEYDDDPLISVLIAARNEEKYISRCLKSISAQTYKNLEILVLDDNSEDRTRAEAKKVSENDNRIHILKGKPLLRGWTGKTFACYQLSQAARGGFFFFADADTVYEVDAVESAYRCLVANDIDALSAKARQIMESLHERIVGTLVYYGIFSFVPLFLIKYKIPICTNASGAFFLIKKKVYENIDGHRKIRKEYIDDINLARSIARNKYSFMLFNGSKVFRTRMYDSLKEIYDGFTRVFLGLFSFNRAFLSIMVFMMNVVLLFPFLLIFVMPLLDFSAYPVYLSNIFMVVFQILIILTVKLVLAVKYKSNIWDIIFHPISIIYITIMSIKLIFSPRKKYGVKWQGRQYNMN
jgi:chlorobactene glucosyltransferase